MKKAEERLVFKKLLKIAKKEFYRDDVSYETIINDIISGKLKLENFIYGKDIPSMINSCKNIKAFREMFIKVNEMLYREENGEKNGEE